MSDFQRGKTIANKLVRAALAKGYRVSVYDGEAYPVKRSVKEREIIAALASTDCDHLVLRDAGGMRVGSIMLIYENGEDVISDHTDVPAINELVREVDNA